MNAVKTRLLALGLWLLAYCPETLTRLWIKGLARLGFRWATRRKTIVQRNLHQAFPQATDREIDALTRQHFESMLWVLVETAWAWMRPVAQLKKPFTLHGLEHLHAAQAAKQGVLLLGGHLMHLELCGCLLAQQVRLAISYKKSSSPPLNALMHRGRSYYAQQFDKEELRGMIRYLKDGGTLWYAPDLHYRGKQSAQVDFFDTSVWMPTTAPVLAKLGQAKTLMFLFHRDASGWVLQIRPLDHWPSDDAVADTQIYAHTLEQYIRAHPAQYFWSNRRFKETVDYT